MPGARDSDEGEDHADEGREGLLPQLLFAVRYTKVVETQKVQLLTWLPFAKSRAFLSAR
jgi:hypothetical protein